MGLLVTRWKRRSLSVSNLFVDASIAEVERVGLKV
jgi:hypothetical protein